MPNINEDIAPFVRQWVAGVDRVLQNELRRRKIGVTGNLKRNLKNQVQQRSTEVIASIIMPYSGRFVDMGAGKGQTARAARGARRTKRKKKPWYNRNVYGALNSLQGAIGFTIVDNILNDFQQQNPNKIEF